MIRHIVMWKFRPGTEAEQAQFLDALRALQGLLQIPPGSLVVAGPVKPVGPADQVLPGVGGVQLHQPGQVLNLLGIAAAGGGEGGPAPEGQNVVRLQFQEFGQVPVHVRFPASAAQTFRLVPAEGPQEIKCRILRVGGNGAGKQVYGVFICSVPKEAGDRRGVWTKGFRPPERVGLIRQGVGQDGRIYALPYGIGRLERFRFRNRLPYWDRGLIWKFFR